jgi:hypothetical protein
MLARRAPRQANMPLLLGLAALAALLIVFVVYGLRSSGTYYDDDIAHFLIARFSWSHPELFLDRWGRPAFTLLYAPVALLGFRAVRLYSALLAAATCLGGAYLARLYGVRWYWLAALFIGLQPELLRQAFSALTELTFALIFCLALIAYKQQRWGLMALAAGWLPLARYESLPIVALFALILLRRRQLPQLLLVAAPLLIQNAFWAARLGSGLLLLFPFDHLFGPGAHQLTFNYGAGDPLYFIRLLPGAFGLVPLALALVGALRERLGLLSLSVLLAVGTLSLAYWLLPGTGIAGYARYLALVAPAVGVLAALGVQWLLEALARWLPAALPWRAALPAVAGGLLAAVLIVVLAVTTLSSVKPFGLTQEQQLEIQAAAWLTRGPYAGRRVLGSDTYFLFAAGLDPYDPRAFQPITLPNIEGSAAGSLIVWDSHYSNRLVYNTPLPYLQDPAHFQPLQSWTRSDVQIYIFQKLG